MRSKLGKIVRAKFDESMKKLLPSFSEDSSAIVPSGCKVYRLEISPSFTAFVTLLISPKDDSYTVDIGWSHNGEYPHSTFTQPEEVSSQGDARFRLGHTFGSRQDFWWYLARRTSLDDDFFSFVEDPIDVAIGRVDAAIADTFEKILYYAVPYFERRNRETSTAERSG